MVYIHHTKYFVQLLSSGNQSTSRCYYLTTTQGWWLYASCLDAQ